MKRDTKASIARQSEAVGQRVEQRNVPELVEWATEALNEMKAFHSLAYPSCNGGCPTHYIIDGLAKALAPF